MKSLEEIARKVEEYKRSDGTISIPITPKRLRSLGTTLKELKEFVTSPKYPPVSGLSDLTSGQLKTVGEMEYLLNNFFPDGKVPEGFSEYARIVGTVRQLYGNEYSSVLERKLREDEALIDAAKSGKSRLTPEEGVYARSLVDVVEAEEVKRENSRLIILYNGETLYEGDIRDKSFSDLPLGSAVVFDYTPQGLTLNLRKTMEENPGTEDKIEKAVLRSLADDPTTKRYIDEVNGQIDEALTKL